jgi:hypothetical protein
MADVDDDEIAVTDVIYATHNKTRIAEDESSIRKFMVISLRYCCLNCSAAEVSLKECALGFGLTKRVLLLLLNMDSFQQKVQLIVLEAFKYIFSIEN